MNISKLCFSILFSNIILAGNVLAQIRKCKIPDADSFTNERIEICENCHFGGQACLGSPFCAECISPPGRKEEKSNPVFRVLRYTVNFDPSVEYNISATGNQDDWNKFTRVYSDACDNDQYYVSLGWRWRLNPPGLDLGPFILILILGTNLLA